MDSKEKLKKDRWSSEKEIGKGYFEEENNLLLDKRLKATLRLAKKAGVKKRYLDTGCRDGFLTNLISKETGNPKTFGIDIVELERARKKDIKAVQLDLEERTHFPFKDKSFDLISCNEVLEHVQDTEFLIEEFYRLLNDEGHLLLSVPRLDSLLSSLLLLLGYQPVWVECSIKRRYGGLTSDAKITGHISYFTKKALTEMLSFYNFEIISFSQVSVVSQWLLDQYILKRKISSLKKIICTIMDSIPFKQDTMILLCEKRAKHYS